MIERVTSDTLIAKVLRVALVFALVFWSTFHVEALAYAALKPVNVAEHEAGTLSNLEVWEVNGEQLAASVRSVRDSAAEPAVPQSREVSLSIGGSLEFVAVPAWAAAPNPDNPNPDNPNPDNPDPDNPNPDNPNPDNPNPDNPEPENPNPDNPEPDNPSPDSPNPDNQGGEGGEVGAQAVSTASTRPMPAAEQSEPDLAAQDDESKGDVEIANFVEWKVSDESVASITEANGKATLTAKAGGTVTVTCSLKPEAAALPVATFASEFPDKPFEASFTVKVAKPYVWAIKLYLPDNTLYSNVSEPVVIKDDSIPYNLRAEVSVKDDSMPDEDIRYESTPSRGLAEASGNRFKDLEWVAENLDGTKASEDDIKVENGSITSLKGKSTYRVRCVSKDGPAESPNGEIDSSILVRSANAVEDPQGPYNPQNVLTVAIDVPGTEPEADETKTDKSNKDSGASSSSSAVSAQADSDKNSDESSDENSDGKALKSTSKTYDYEKGDLEPFTIRNAGEPDEYSMMSPNGELKVKGAGPGLQALIYDAADPGGKLGLDPKTKPLDIESVEFVIDGGKSVTVPWSDLVAVSGPNNLILASNSYVEVGDSGLKGAAVEGENSDAAASESSAAVNPSESSASANPSDGSSKDLDAGLLPNTRFRLLYNGSGKDALQDPNDFRYINKVIVHVKGEKEEPPERGDVYIAYTPVRKGNKAALSPQFKLEKDANGNNLHFNIEWQTSPDKSDGSWKTVDASSKTDASNGLQLNVLTNDETIGTYRRFILTVSQYVNTAGETVEEQAIPSDPVEIIEGKGFLVKLEYVPVFAGETATFRAIPVIDPEDDEVIDLSQIYYEWQMSVDYGQTWIGEDNPSWPKLLREQSGKQATTLNVPTKKIEEKANGSSGDEGGEGSSDKDSSEKDDTPPTWLRVVAHHNGKETASVPVLLAVRTDTSGKEQNQPDKAEDLNKAIEQINNEATEPTQAVTQIGSPVYEGPANAGVEVGPADNQVYVNEAVSQEIARQEQEKNAKPGARWTELKNVNPTNEEVNDILGINPFFPFAAPMALGITAAGAVEKLIGFRRQTH